MENVHYDFNFLPSVQVRFHRGISSSTLKLIDPSTVGYPEIHNTKSDLDRFVIEIINIWEEDDFNPEVDQSPETFNYIGYIAENGRWAAD